MILYVVVCLVRDTCRVLSFVGNLIQRPCSPKSKPTVSMGPEVKQMDMNQSQVQNLQFVYQSSKGNKACFGMKQRIRGFQRRVWSQKKSMRLYEHRAYMYIYIYWKSFWTLSFFFFTYIYIYILLIPNSGPAGIVPNRFISSEAACLHQRWLHTPFVEIAWRKSTKTSDSLYVSLGIYIGVQSRIKMQYTHRDWTLKSRSQNEELCVGLWPGAKVWSSIPWIFLGLAAMKPWHFTGDTEDRKTGLTGFNHETVGDLLGCMSWDLTNKRFWITGI